MKHILSTLLFAALFCFSNILIAGVKPGQKNTNRQIAVLSNKHRAKRDLPAQKLSYPSPKSFLVNVPITPLAPTSSGISALAYQSETKVIGSGFNEPSGVAVDASGDVYVADQGNNAVDEIVGGSGTPVNTGYSFSQPSGVAVDAYGDVIVTNFSDNTLSEIFVGGAAEQFSDGFNQPAGIAISPSGNIYIADEGNNAIKKMDDIGGSPVAIGSGFSSPAGVAVDALGNVYVADYGNNAVKEILIGNGATITIGTGFNRPTGVAVDAAGNVFVADQGNGAIKEILAGSGNTIAIIAGFTTVTGVAVDNIGNVYAVNSGDGYINKILPAGGYFLSNALPAGLNFNNANGIITGTPTTAGNFTKYTVTAYNSSGNSVSAQFSIKITPIAPPTISYSSPETYAAGVAITPLTPTSSTVASPGFSGATMSIGSGFNEPVGIAADASGNIYVADAGNNAVKEILVGNSIPITIGSGFNSPQCVAVDAGGNVYVADAGNHAIKEIPAGNGPVILLSSNFSYPQGIAVDAAGNVYVADYGNKEVNEILAGSGTIISLGSGFTSPSSVAVDGSANVYVTDIYENLVEEIPAGNGAPMVLGSGFNNPTGVAVDPAGNVYVADTETGKVKEILAGNPTPVIIAGFTAVGATAVDGSGNVYACTPNSTVTQITPSGGYYLIAALPAGLSFNTATGSISGAPATTSQAKNYTVTAYNAGGGTSAQVNITVDAFTLSYASPETYNLGTTIIPLAPKVIGAAIAAPAFGTHVTAVGSGFNVPAGAAVDAAGNIYVADVANNAIKKIPAGGGTPIIVGSGFNGPAGIAIDALGNIYVSDTNNNEVKEIPAGGGGTPHVLGSGFSKPYGITVDAAGDVFVADYGNNAVKKIPAGSNTPVTIGSGFVQPLGVAVDAAGNIYVTDSGNGEVKEIPAAGGAVAILGTGYGLPAGIAIDPSSNLYICDQSNNKVYEMPSTGGVPAVIWTGFSGPTGVAIDASGNVYMANLDLTTLIEIKPVGGYYLSAFLPAGLSFSSTTGTVSGTPTASTTAANYTVTAYTSTASNFANLNIGVTSNIATLSGLKASIGTLSPVFASGTTTYTDMVTNGTTSVTITPTTTDPGAAVTVNGVAVPTGKASAPIALTVGSNTVNVIVTAFNGVAKQTYTVNVVRPSTNAKLSALAISAGTLAPVFNANTTSYTAAAGSSVNFVTITPTVAVTGATVTVNGTPVTSGSASGAITLSPGINAVLVVVTAQDGVTADTYSLAVTKAAASIDDNLANITLSKGTISPAFGSGVTSYTDMVTNGTTSVTLTPTTEDPTATLTVNGAAVISGKASAAIALNVGSNTATIIVTAQDGIEKKTYTVNIIRPSTNAKLSALTLSSGTLTPVFNTNTVSYTASVPFATSTINLTPTVAATGATVTINGTAVLSGAASGAIALNSGSNTITTIVTAQDGVTTDTYTLTVTRAAGSSNDNLSALAVSKGTLTPTFAVGATSYTDMVTNGTTSLTFTPTAQDITATITVNGTKVNSGAVSGAITLAVGSNPVNIVVTAQDGVSVQTYTVNVIRPSTNAKLSAFAISSGTLTPAFNTNTTSYSASVTNTISSIIITPTVAVTGASVKVNGTTVTSGEPSGTIALSVGVNTITTVVTAQDGTTTDTYTVTVTRAMAGANDVYEPIDKPTGVGVQNFEPLLADDGINVHQGVSPNGDGIDDFLQIDNISRYPDNRLVIMNRNGVLVFEAKGYDNATKVFDGHSNKNGQMQLPGTYFYELDYTVGGIVKHKTGFLVLKY